jgi:hypothetical protein
LANTPTDTHDFVVKNNLIYNSDYLEIDLGGSGNWKGHIDIDYNLYYKGGANIIAWNGTTYQNLVNYQSGTGREAHGIQNTNGSVFNNAVAGDYRPLAGSPACTMSSTGSYVGALPCAGSPPANTAPTHATPILNASDNPMNSTNATLNCYNQSTSDADGDPVTNSYRWFRNNTLMGSLTSSSVNQGNTTTTDIWICEVRPYDGTDYGTRRNSSSLTIRPYCSNGLCEATENCSTCASDCGVCNTAPTHSTPILNASDNPNNSTDATLRCYNQSTSDANGDTVTNYYRWFRNATLMGALTANSVGPGNTSTTDSWVCEVRPYDGIDYGTRRNSSMLTIRAYCSNGACEATESCLNCVADCGTCGACGDATCDGNESCSICEADCGACPFCGDTTCDVNETCSNCETDCGVCLFCGDATCDANETCSNCETDCGACPVCGNDVCESGESCSNCAADCGRCTGGGGGGGGGSTTRTWTCSAWSSCVNGIEQQICSSGSEDNLTTRRCGTDGPAAPTGNETVHPIDNQTLEETPLPQKATTEPETDNLSPESTIQEETPGVLVTKAKRVWAKPLVYAAIIASIVAVFSAMILLRKCPEKPESPHTQQLKDYIKKAKKAGHTKTQIRSKLLKAGWDEKIVERAMHKK